MKSKPFIEMLKPDDVVVFVGAHPDDETLAGPVLAWATDHCRKMAVISMTKGESGWNLEAEDLTQTLAQVREKEFDAAIHKLGGEPILLDYINGTSMAHPEGLAVKEDGEGAVPRWRGPDGRDISAEAAYERWIRQCGNPEPRLAKLFLETSATVIIALDPQTGVTGHEEHIAATRAVTAAVRQCRQTGKNISLYYVVRPPNVPREAECILTANLNSRGGKDYGRIAQESRGFYVSQYSPEQRSSLNLKKEVYLLPASP